MSPPELTRSPKVKANPPSAHCIKPTKQMANYVAAADDFVAPFDAMQNAVLPFAHTSLYVAMPNTSSNIETSTVKATKKSPEPALARIPRAPTALTP